MKHIKVPPATTPSLEEYQKLASKVEEEDTNLSYKVAPSNEGLHITRNVPESNKKL